MGILLVYDISDQSSFNNIRNWMRNIEQHASDNVNKVRCGSRGWAMAGAVGTEATDEQLLRGLWQQHLSHWGLQEGLARVGLGVRCTVAGVGHDGMKVAEQG